MMRNQSGIAFKCGPFALQQICADFYPNVNAKRLIEAKSTTNGFSLAQLKKLSDDCGLDYRMARRTAGARVPIPSVVHWKLNHYGTVVKEDKGRYLIKDATFGYLYSNELWVDA